MDNIVATKSTLKQIGDCLLRNGPMTIVQLGEVLHLSKARVYDTLRSRDVVGLAIGGRVRFITIVGGDKLSGYVFGFDETNEEMGYDVLTGGSLYARGDAASVDKWLKPTLTKLRLHRGNPFALLALPQKKR